MAKTFTGPFTTTQVLSNPATDNPATVTSSGTITVNSTTANAIGLNGNSGFAWTLTNLGTVQSIGSNGLGIVLQSGGLVTNGAGSSTNAYVYGTGTGIQINGSPGTVVNYGTIRGTGAIGYGVFLAAGGSIANFGSAGLIEGSTGIVIGGAAGTVTNTGTIDGTGIGSNGGIALAMGGSVANVGTAALIEGYNGVAVYSAAGTVTNSGTIDGTGTVVGAVSLDQGGTVTNSRMLAGEAFGVDIANTSGTVINLGTITATNTSAFQATGVSLFVGGSITNGAGTATTALIEGVQYGAQIGNAAGTVVNFGSIVATATGGTGLRLVHGGSIDNLGTITGPAAGIFLDRATSVTNGKSGTAKGYISGQTGVNMQGPGNVTNYGRIVGAGIGSTTGLYFVRGGTVHNFGTITAGGTAGNAVDFAFLNAGAIVVNGKSGSTAGLITGVSVGVSVEASGGTVTNFARITGGTDGVDMFGTVAVVLNNFGTIDGGSHGAYLGGSAGAKVVNSGTINGGAEGIYTRDSAARVTNSATGIIENSTGYVINLTAGGTVINQGQILAGNTLRAAVHISNAAGSSTIPVRSSAEREFTSARPARLPTPGRSSAPTPPSRSRASTSPPAAASATWAHQA